jgi:hypothetical protein
VGSTGRCACGSLQVDNSTLCFVVVVVVGRVVILTLGRRVILLLLLKMRAVKTRHRPSKAGQVDGPESGQVGTYERRRQVLMMHEGKYGERKGSKNGAKQKKNGRKPLLGYRLGKSILTDSSNDLNRSYMVSVSKCYLINRACLCV